MKILVAGALLCALCAPVLAQNAPTKEAKNAPPTVEAGELRLDGKIKAVLNVGEWQMEAVSWTSPRQVTTGFDEPKSKTIKVGATVYIHPLGETEKVALKDVKLGARIAVIGKNSADGSLSAREVILLEGYGARKTLGTLNSNPFTSAFVAQSRKARDEGNMIQAMAFIEKAISTAQGLNDLSGEGLATQDKVLLLLDNDQVEEAGKASARVEALGRNLSNTLLITTGMTGRANVLMGIGKLKEAIEILEAADPISAGSDPGIQVSVLRLMVRAYNQAEKPKELTAALQRLFPIQESLRQGDEATRTLLMLANVQADSDAAASRETLKQAVARIPDTSDEKQRAALTVIAGTTRYSLGDKDAAKADFETAAKLLESVADTKGAVKMRAMFDEMEIEKKKKAGDKTPATPDANKTDE